MGADLSQVSILAREQRVKTKDLEEVGLTLCSMPL